MNEYTHMLNHRVRSQELMKQAANIRLGNETDSSSWLLLSSLGGTIGALIAVVIQLIRRS